jgi:phosphomevalonate kinase
MGSSAALTTSMVAALLEFFSVTHFRLAKETSAELRILHRLSQICHAIAQGKVKNGRTLNIGLTAVF